MRWWRTMELGMPDVILRWLQYMSTFDVEVEYRPGKDHGNGDGLSRPPVVWIAVYGPVSARMPQRIFRRY